MSERLNMQEIAVSSEYKKLLEGSWVGFLGSEQWVLHFTEEPEGYKVRQLSIKEAYDINSHCMSWAPTVLLHLESYGKLSDQIKRKKMLADSEILDPVPWLYDDKTLIFWQQTPIIALELDFDFVYFKDTPYFESLLGKKVSERSAGAIESGIGRFLPFLKKGAIR